jgi:hypothetical protein
MKQSTRFIPTNRLERYDLVNEQGQDLGQVTTFVAHCFRYCRIWRLFWHQRQVVRRALGDHGVVSREEEVRC